MKEIESRVVPIPVAQVSRAEQFSLWAIRIWWSRFPELDAVWPKLAQGFRAFGMPAALESLHGFCSIALVMAEDIPTLACSRCTSINRDEERLLRILRLAAQGQTHLTFQELLSDLPAGSARIAARHAERFAQLLTVSGLEWPRGNEPDGEKASATSGRHSQPSSRLH
jgi:hypothetical protein